MLVCLIMTLTNGSDMALCVTMTRCQLVQQLVILNSQLNKLRLKSVHAAIIPWAGFLLCLVILFSFLQHHIKSYCSFIFQQHFYGSSSVWYRGRILQLYWPAYISCTAYITFLIVLFFLILWRHSKYNPKVWQQLLMICNDIDNSVFRTTKFDFE